MPAASRNGNSAYAFWDKQHFKNRAVFFFPDSDLLLSFRFLGLCLRLFCGCCLDSLLFLLLFLFYWFFRFLFL